MNRLDNLFFELKGIKILNNHKRIVALYKNWTLEIKNGDVKSTDESYYIINSDFTNTEEVINQIKENKKEFDNVKNEILSIINTPLEEKKKYIYEHLEELDNEKK